jgi:hypothetical protein
VAYFQQTQVEEMCSQLDATPLSHLAARFPAAREQELRNQLGSFGVKGGTATQPLHTLSGGQAVRVALAAVFFSRPHCLVLDEPSNHLDLEGVGCLAEALRQYAGAVLLVSHDQASGSQGGEAMRLKGCSGGGRGPTTTFHVLCCALHQGRRAGPASSGSACSPSSRSAPVPHGMQWLVEQAAQRVFLVADGEVQLLEDGVREYVQLLSGKGKKKAASKAGGGGGKPVAQQKAAPTISAGKVAALKRAAMGKR